MLNERTNLVGSRKHVVARSSNIIWKFPSLAILACNMLRISSTHRVSEINSKIRVVDHCLITVINSLQKSPVQNGKAYKQARTLNNTELNF